eukprot:GHVU01025196.1.p1 GENE.GHVU01025196.1~~GHVU01025196.1.p1  ORF type:complete len:335 (-),score=38.25 GHVU01025196.1:1047-2051(-)
MEIAPVQLGLQSGRRPAIPGVRVQQRVPKSRNGNGDPVVDKRRKAVNNTWVTIWIDHRDDVDTGPTQQVALVTPEQHAADTFLGCVHTPVPTERVWETETKKFHVELDGDLVGSYDVDGRTLKHSMDTILGAQYQESYSHLSRYEERRLFTLQVIEVTALIAARLSYLELKLRVDAPPVTPTQYSAMTQLEFATHINLHMPRFVRVAEEGVTEAQLRATLQTEHATLRDDIGRTEECDERDFATMWAPYKNTCPYIFMLACGLATVFPGDAKVERLFADLKYQFSERRKGTTVFALTGALMCRDAELLRQLLSVEPGEALVESDELESESGSQG